MINIGNTNVASAVTNQTTTIAKIHDPSPRIVSPLVKTEARINAINVDNRPMPPRNADACRLATLKTNGDSIV